MEASVDIRAVFSKKEKLHHGVHDCKMLRKGQSMRYDICCAVWFKHGVISKISFCCPRWEGMHRGKLGQMLLRARTNSSTVTFSWYIIGLGPCQLTLRHYQPRTPEPIHAGYVALAESLSTSRTFNGQVQSQTAIGSPSITLRTPSIEICREAIRVRQR